MPSIVEHLKTAKRNYDISKLLLDTKNEYTEWIVISLFYSAVHFLEAYLASLPVPYHPGSQSERSVSVARHFSKDCYKKYALLKDKSIEARYYCKLFKLEYIRSSVIPAFEFFKNRVNEKLPKAQS